MAVEENYIPDPEREPLEAHLHVATVSLRTDVVRPAGNPFAFEWMANYVSEFIFMLNDTGPRVPFDRSQGAFSQDNSFADKEVFGHFEFNVDTKYGVIGVRKFVYFAGELHLRPGSTVADLKLYATVALILNGVAAYPDIREGAVQIYDDVITTSEKIRKLDMQYFHFNGSISCDVSVQSEEEMRRLVELEYEKFHYP